jgi:hypothetical protein
MWLPCVHAVNTRSQQQPGWIYNQRYARPPLEVPVADWPDGGSTHKPQAASCASRLLQARVWPCHKPLPPGAPLSVCRAYTAANPCAICKEEGVVAGTLPMTTVCEARQKHVFCTAACKPNCAWPQLQAGPPPASPYMHRAAA